MAEKNAIHGWLNIDKPYGMSSAQAVTAVKKILHPKKIGHAGTLDPLATGVLPLALGEATKTVHYVMNATKHYRFTITFGTQTDTDDLEGEVINTSDIIPNESDIKTAISTFLGEIEQTPPAFSAIKIDGKRAYEIARSGKDVKMKSRKVTIESLTLLSIKNKHQATFNVTCSKGTYVRSLARDIALALGSVGHVSMLRRTGVGKVLEKNIILLEKLEELVHNMPPSGELTDYLLINNVILPPDIVLDDIPAVRINEDMGTRLRRGQALLASEVGDTTHTLAMLHNLPLKDIGEGRIVRLVKAMTGTQLTALLELKGRRLLTVRVFKY